MTVWYTVTLIETTYMKWQMKSLLVSIIALKNRLSAYNVNVAYFSLQSLMKWFSRGTWMIFPILSLRNSTVPVETLPIQHSFILFYQSRKVVSDKKSVGGMWLMMSPTTHDVTNDTWCTLCKRREHLFLSLFLQRFRAVESKFLFMIGSGFPVKIIYCLVFNDDM